MRTQEGTRGNWGTVEFAEGESGRSETREVFDGLSKTEKAGIHITMQRLADEGRVENPERFKIVEGSRLWEIKKGQHRFVGGFLPGRRFVITAYELKKRDKLRPQTVERAASVMRLLRKEKVEETCVKPRA